MSSPDVWLLGSISSSKEFYIMDWHGNWVSPDTVLYESLERTRGIKRGFQTVNYWSGADRANWDILVFPLSCFEEFKKRLIPKEESAVGTERKGP